MMVDVTERWRQAGITDDQAAGAVAFLADAPAGQVRGYVVVALLNNPGSPGRICVVSSYGTDRKSAVTVLSYAANHLTGRCRHCAREGRKALRRETGWRS